MIVVDAAIVSIAIFILFGIAFTASVLRQVRRSL